MTDNSEQTLFQFRHRFLLRDIASYTCKTAGF